MNAVERQGGRITCVYFNKLGLRLHIYPEKFTPPIPRFARPPDKLLKVYADATKRGFLAPAEERERLRIANVEKMEALRKEMENNKI